jgi:hypothetical protein
MVLPVFYLIIDLGRLMSIGLKRDGNTEQLDSKGRSDSMEKENRSNHISCTTHAYLCSTTGMEGGKKKLVVVGDRWEGMGSVSLLTMIVGGGIRIGSRELGSCKLLLLLLLWR